MAELMRCNLCQRFGRDDPKLIIIAKCGHTMHFNCMRRWSLLVGPYVKCVLCLDDDSKLADGPRKCPSCKPVVEFQTKKEIRHHVYVYHDKVTCEFCGFDYMRQQIENHLGHLCQGPRCGLCMDLCNEKESMNCGHYVHDECMNSWNHISIKCVLCSTDGVRSKESEKMICPIYNCGTKMKFSNWEGHLVKEHKGFYSLFGHWAIGH